MYNVQQLYGSSMCTDDNHSLKLVDFSPVHTDEPYTKLHLLSLSSVQHQIIRDAQGAGC